jgi:hypothetical protein
MSWDYIIAGDYGQVGKLTFTDVDTLSAADISSYTTAQQMILRDPDGNEATKTAAFDSDGSDGIIKYTLADGDIDEPGMWLVRGRVTTGSAQLTTEWHEFEVLK